MNTNITVALSVALAERIISAADGNVSKFVRMILQEYMDQIEKEGDSE